MNDFTKDELQRILEGVAWWLDGDSALYSKQLIDKIHSMIDSHCEHKSDGMIYASYPPQNKCTLCGEFYR